MDWQPVSRSAVALLLLHSAHATVSTPSSMAHIPVAVARRQLAAKALRQLDGECADCADCLAVLSRLDDEGLTFELGGNALKKSMRVCADTHHPLEVEKLFDRLVQEKLVDIASLEILVAARLADSKLSGAATAAAYALALFNEEWAPGRACPERLARCAQQALATCTAADVPAPSLDAALLRLEERGALPRPPDEEDRAAAKPPTRERTLAMLKPDALSNGHAAAILSTIRARGFEVVAARRWRMDNEDAASFLAASWGGASGDRRRKFFTSMVDFYSSGDVLALLLERDDAIDTWRQLLGERGDPTRCDEGTVRRLFGTNRQANAAHGADSAAAVAREVRCVFGYGWNEPGWAPVIFAPTVERALQELRRRGIRVAEWDEEVVDLSLS